MSRLCSRWQLTCIDLLEDSKIEEANALYRDKSIPLMPFGMLFREGAQQVWVGLRVGMTQTQSKNRCGINTLG